MSFFFLFSVFYKINAAAHVPPLVFLRLMVNLTQPAMLCFGKVPDDPVFRHHFLEVTSHLQAYKEVS